MTPHQRHALACTLVGSAAWLGACTASAVPDGESGAASNAASARAFWAIYRDAGAARSADRPQDAIALYRDALAIRPDHEDSLYYLGNCLLERRDYAAAMGAYERLVAVNPAGSSRGYMQLASIRASLDLEAPIDLPRARILFERALAIDPDSGALLGLAEVALRERRLGDAGRLLADVEADNPMSVAAPYLRGYLAFARGDGAAAWTFFTAAVSRAELKKAAVKWTEEGDVKASPQLRWRALTRQSVFGPMWAGLRDYLAPPGPTRADMAREYERLHGALVKPRP